MGRPKIRDANYLREYKKLKAREYYKNNPEKYRTSSKKYGADNKTRNRELRKLRKSKRTISEIIYCRLYNVHNMMIGRCYNHLDKRYHRYGGRGITVCKEWLDDKSVFIKWAIDNGYTLGLTIDRIDNNEGYSPKNCRWVNKKTQNNNKNNNIKITHEGEVRTLSQWADHFHILPSTLHYRYKKGMRPPEMFAEKIKRTNPNDTVIVDLNTGVFYESFRELSRLLSVKENTLRYRIFNNLHDLGDRYKVLKNDN